MYRYPHQLSGGRRRRVAIARAMIPKPEFVVDDEHVSMIDLSLRASILELLMSFKNESSAFISHDLSVAKIAVMYPRKIDSVINDVSLHRSFAFGRSVLCKKNRVEIVGDVPDPKIPPPGCRFHPRCPFAQKICSEEEPKMEKVGLHTATMICLNFSMSLLFSGHSTKACSRTSSILETGMISILPLCSASSKTSSRLSFGIITFFKPA